MNRYRIIIFKELHFIPEIFTISSPFCVEDIIKRINKSLDGNAICFTDIKGKIRFYDRNIIAKIFIKTAGYDNED